MALSVIQRHQSRPTGQTATTVLSPTATIVAGKLPVICGVGGSSKVISSVTDSVGGNTWVVDTTDATGAQGKSFASSQIVTPITSGDTITITWSNATSSAIALWLQEVSGAATSSAFDKTATNGATGTAATSGSTGTLSQANEIAFAVFRTGVSSTWTNGGSWTQATTFTDGVNCALEYQIVSSTAALNADATAGTSGSWTALTATYKAANPIPPSNTVAPAATGTAASGSILTTTTGTWTGDPVITYTYQWQEI